MESSGGAVLISSSDIPRQPALRHQVPIPSPPLQAWLPMGRERRLPPQTPAGLRRYNRSAVSQERKSMSSDPARVGIEPRRQASRRTRKMLLSAPMHKVSAVLVAMVVIVFGGMQQLLNITGHGWSPGLFGFLLGSGLSSVG